MLSPMINRAVTLAALAAVVAGCAGSDGKSGSDTAGGAAKTSSGGVDLTGAGATFPQPIYNKWFADYAQQTGVKINYQAIGSGGGIRQLSEQTVDFGASDSPMKDEEIARAKGGPVMHIPTVIGAVVLAYNVPEVQQPLKLDGPTIADIFLGKIKKWNDPRIAQLNGGVQLPATDILVVHRSDGSGTTYIFSEYLAKVSPAWRAAPGVGKELKWPTGLGARGNEGVSAQIKQLPGAIGYTELAYARQNSLKMASVKNKAGAFVVPSPAAATAAAEAAVAAMGPNSDYRVSIVDAEGADAYPISSFTWLLVYQNPTDATKAKKLNDFIKWALTTGQQSAPTLDYAPLPSVLVQQLQARIGATPAS